jgi:hypothetical protein
MSAHRASLERGSAIAVSIRRIIDLPQGCGCGCAAALFSLDLTRSSDPWN